MPGAGYPRYLKRQIIPLFHEYLGRLPAADRNEMGLPSYLHPNPALRWVYWRRLDVVLSMVGTGLETVLDFGCGPGVLLPVLSSVAQRVYAVDLRPETAQDIVAELGLDNVTTAQTIGQLPLYADSVDLIVALDVLEHVTNLGVILQEFHRVLTPAGKLVISGPTENVLYRLGRRLAGFTGDYHKRSIYQVLDSTRKLFRIRRQCRLFTVYPFFLIAECQKAYRLVRRGQQCRTLLRAAMKQARRRANPPINSPS